MDKDKKDEGIILENLNIFYSDGNNALQDINLKLTVGKIFGLVGVNGAGKSTLFKAIMGILKPSTGKILIFGESNKRALSKNWISYVPQIEEVDWDFPILVKDLVMMGRYNRMNFIRWPSRQDKKLVDEALDRVDMLNFKERQIGELSGGQKKRIFVARSLTQGSPIILMDEPFAGVDITTEEALVAMFKELALQGYLIMVSTHNLGSVPSFCDDVILLNQTVLASGPVVDTFNEQNLIKAFGGKLRHNIIIGSSLHKDQDDRSITVMTDDERALVLYGQKGDQFIVGQDKNDKNKKDL